MDISQVLSSKRNIYKAGKLRIDSQGEKVIGQSLDALSGFSIDLFENAFMSKRVLQDTVRLQKWMPASVTTRLYLSGRDYQNCDKMDIRNPKTD